MNFFYSPPENHLVTAEGELHATIHNNFKFPDFKGIPQFFVTNEKVVVISTRHQITENQWNSITVTFPYLVENRRYEFQVNSGVEPPLFVESCRTADGGSLHRPHPAKDDVGHIIFDFDPDAGTLEATFNYTIIGDQSTGHQAVGNIKIKGLTHTNGYCLEKLFSESNASD